MMHGLNAQRFKGKPLRQPTYSVKDVPKCAKDLQGSSLQEVTDREHFNDAMAEMVLLCKEAMRRLSHDKLNGKKPSKPLSLEYIADRLDVDDPIFGYFVRTESAPTDATEKWKQGMLQGFITVTTFTNWQKTFRWDSLHDSAFSYDDRNLAAAMASGERRYDQDGSLAAELQGTVRCGDPWNEGIVWPRIAEVSLLGGLGCGKALLSLVIEKLETMKASGTRNYDYLVLQATDNSVPFYESMGFVRVGAVTEDPDFDQKMSADSDDGSPVSIHSAVKASSSFEHPTAHPQSEIVSSPVETYVTNAQGECPVDIAKKLNVDVWDIIFLNQYIFKEIAPRSRLLEGTSLFVPSNAAEKDALSSASRSDSGDDELDTPQWYVASENETPKGIANKFNLNCADLVQANRGRLPELQGLSRLKEGTRIRVSHFHLHDEKHVPYCHWTFPDDSFETNVPSYMMVRKLDRKGGRAGTLRPIEQSLTAKIVPYSTPDPSMFVTAKVAATTPQMEARKPQKKNDGHYPGEPIPPRRPLCGYFLFLREQREARKDELEGLRASDATKILSKMWHDLPEKEKGKYQAEHERERVVYQHAMIQYKKDLAAFQEANPELKPPPAEVEHPNLFSKVVKLTPEGVEHAASEFEYFFVLTYIPDLQWCHLAPMRQAGTWGPDKPRCEGRPIWMLVDESEGKELDISSSFCVPIKSRAMKHTVDADREQWDILNGVEETLEDLYATPAKKKRGGGGASKSGKMPKKKGSGRHKHGMSNTKGSGRGGMKSVGLSTVPVALTPEEQIEILSTATLFDAIVSEEPVYAGKGAGSTKLASIKGFPTSELHRDALVKFCESNNIDLFPAGTQWHISKGEICDMIIPYVPVAPSSPDDRIGPPIEEQMAILSRATLDDAVVSERPVLVGRKGGVTTLASIKELPTYVIHRSALVRFCEKNDIQLARCKSVYVPKCEICDIILAHLSEGPDDRDPVTQGTTRRSRGLPPITHVLKPKSPANPKSPLALLPSPPLDPGPPLQEQIAILSQATLDDVVVSEKPVRVGRKGGITTLGSIKEMDTYVIHREALFSFCEVNGIQYARCKSQYVPKGELCDIILASVSAKRADSKPAAAPAAPDATMVPPNPPANGVAAAAAPPSDAGATDEPLTRKRGRPPKKTQAATAAAMPSSPGDEPPAKKRRGRPPKRAPAPQEASTATQDQVLSPRAARRLARSVIQPIGEADASDVGLMMPELAQLDESARPTRKAAAAAAEAIHQLDDRARSPDSVVPIGQSPSRKLPAAFEKRVLTPTRNGGQLKGEPTSESKRPSRKAAVEANKAILGHDEAPCCSDGENTTPKEAEDKSNGVGTRERPFRKVAPIFGPSCRVN